MFRVKLTILATEQVNILFAPKATEVLRCREASLCA